MRPIKTYNEFIKESTVNERKKYDYPSFQTNKGIYYQDMLISSGYWSYMGKERYGKGLYMNIDNRQTYGFSPDDIEYFKKHLKDIEVMESALNEAKLSKIHNAAKKGSYPITLVVTEKGKVIKQELVGTPVIVPAAFNQLQKEYPNAKISIESRTGETLFVESVNEAVKLSLDVEEPFSDKEEKKAAAKYKWVPKASPITISKVEGEITEDGTDITIQFSNGDEIYYRWDASRKSAEIVTYNDDSYKVDEDVLDIVFGSTSTVVGDVALVYSKFKDGLNPSLFIKY